MMSALLAALACSVAVPLAAQAGDGIADRERRVAAAEAAQATADRIEAIDRARGAAWSRFTAAADPGADWRAEDPGNRGMLTLPDAADPEAMTVYIVEAGSDVIHLLATYSVTNGRIAEEAIHPEETRPVLPEPAARMMRARQVALSAMDTSEFCHRADDTDTAQRSRIEDYVFPPDIEGNVDVYVIERPPRRDMAYLGSAFRYRVGPEGSVKPAQSLGDSCEVVEWDADDENNALNVFVTRTDVADHPTVVHSLASRRMPLFFGLITGDVIWPISGGAIDQPLPLDETSEYFGTVGAGKD